MPTVSAKKKSTRAYNPKDPETIGVNTKDIDQKLFENLCGIQCTQSEIQNILHATDDRIDNWCMRQYGESYPSVYKRLFDKGHMSIRRAQFALCQKNASMAIWLGKVKLSQREPIGDLVESGALAELCVSNDKLMAQIEAAQKKRADELALKLSEETKDVPRE